jgi:formylglycine-generating enzyme required for sulfatase activity
LHFLPSTGLLWLISPRVHSQWVAVQKKNSDQAAFLGKSLCQVDGDARNREGPQRKVTVPSFQMSKTEVTLGQFKRFIMAAGREDIVTTDFIKYNAHGENAPVTYVSWHDAQAFIKWLNKTHGGGLVFLRDEWMRPTNDHYLTNRALRSPAPMVAGVMEDGGLYGRSFTDGD